MFLRTKLNKNKTIATIYQFLMIFIRDYLKSLKNWKNTRRVKEDRS
jgi:hypothetical protein